MLINAIPMFFLAIAITINLLGGCKSSDMQTVTQGVLHSPKTVHLLDGNAQPVVLVQDGQAKSVIVIPESEEKEKQKKYDFAAEELQGLLQQATGVKLDIVKDSKYAEGQAIFLGNSLAARKAGFDFGELPPDGFRVKTAGGNLAIIGNDADKVLIKGAAGNMIEETHRVDSRGTLFGAYDLLERYLGARFYYPGPLGTIIPQKTSVTIPAVDYEDSPVLKRRTMYPSTFAIDGTKESTNYKFRWRWGNTGIQAVNHSYLGWSDLYGKSKPYIFALNKDGTRSVRGFPNGHLNYVHPEILKLEMEHLERFYKDGWDLPWSSFDEKTQKWKRWVVFPHNSHIPVTPNDCFPGCESEEFQKYVRRYKGKPEDRKISEYSEVIHTYLVNLAGEIKKRWPDRYLLMGAYSAYTLPSPDVKYPNNIIADVCIMDGLAYHKEPDKYAFWINVLKEYKRLTGNTPYCWNYPCWPMDSTKAPVHMPDLVVRWHRDVVKEDILQGEFLCGAPRSFALDHLTFYFWFKAMWNPDFNVRAALDEYYRLSYGPAAPAMKQYFELMISQWEDKPWNVPCGRVGGLPLQKLYGETYSKPVREKLKTLEQQALAAAPAESDFARRAQSVINAHKEFFVEAELFDRLDRGSIVYVEPGTPQAIDGVIDDPCWNREGNQMLYRDSGEPIALKSRVKLCYDDEALYVACDFAETQMDNLKATAIAHDESAWDDDGIEFFLCPMPTPEHYVQIAINTSGICFDGWKEEIAGFTSAKNFRTERKIVKHADGYTMEVKIPWSEMGITAPKPGTSLRGNVIRNRRADKTVKTREIYAISPTLGQSNHNTKFFGTFVFTGNVRFREDFDMESGKNWRAAPIFGKAAVRDPDARATLSVENGVAKLTARMANSHTGANLSRQLSVPVCQGDQLEVRYRGPFAESRGRFSVSLVLKTKSGEKKFGWLADDRALPKTDWRIFNADIFKMCKVADPEAELKTIELILGGEKGMENSIEFDYVIISPDTAATVK